jgi:putative membrane protein
MPRRLVHVVFALFAGGILFSLAGMLALKLVPQSGAVFGPYLPQLMRWPTFLYLATLPLATFVAFQPRLGWGRGVAVLVWGTAVGATAELIGTKTGIPFGAYGYSDFLGPKILDRVPYGIPPSWYASSLMSFAFATAMGLTRLRRVTVAAVFMLCWDIALDPAMSAGFPVWLWTDTGPFYGMPWTNFTGWYATSLLIMAGYELLFRGRALEAGPWEGRIWLVNGLFFVGICAIALLVPATIVGTVAVGMPVALAWYFGRRRVPIA